MTRTVIEVLLGNTAKSQDGCIVWTGMKNGYGYGVIDWQGRRLMVHRVIYEMARGPIPEGLQIDHLCRVRNCVNPNHMEPVAPKENVRRGIVGGFGTCRTHCPAGHLFSGGNLYMTPSGGRRCRICARIHSRRHRAKKAVTL